MQGRGAKGYHEMLHSRLRGDIPAYRSAPGQRSVHVGHARAVHGWPPMVEASLAVAAHAWPCTPSGSFVAPSADTVSSSTEWTSPDSAPRLSHVYFQPQCLGATEQGRCHGCPALRLQASHKQLRAPARRTPVGQAAALQASSSCRDVSSCLPLQLAPHRSRLDGCTAWPPIHVHVLFICPCRAPGSHSA